MNIDINVDVNKIYNKLVDKGFRQKLLADKPDSSAISELGYDLSSGTKFKVVVSKKDVMYIAMPNDTVNLDNISAAGLTVGVGTGATIGSITTTLSTASTAGSAIIYN